MIDVFDRFTNMEKVIINFETFLRFVLFIKLISIDKTYLTTSVEDFKKIKLIRLTVYMRDI